MKATQATGLLLQVKSFKFLLCLVIWKTFRLTAVGTVSLLTRKVLLSFMILVTGPRPSRKRKLPSRFSEAVVLEVKYQQVSNSKLAYTILFWMLS